MKIAYAEPHITPEDISAVVDVLNGTMLTQGKIVPKFEKAIAKYVGAKYAVACNSATSGLAMAYKAVGWEHEIDVTTTPNTFLATVNMLAVAGARVHFRDGYLSDVNVVPVHCSGAPAFFFGETVVEDAAHALGTMVHGKMIGCCDRSSICVFSTHAIKNITTCEGGVCTTNNPDHYEFMKAVRDHGRVHRECQFPGYNYRMSEVQAALGLSQLKRINTMRAMRQDVVDTYNEALRGYVDIPTPRGEDTFYHLYVIHLPTMEQRDKLKSYLKRRGISTQIHYKPVYLEPYYQALGYQKGLCPKAEKHWQTTLSLPLHCNLTKGDVEYVIGAVIRGVTK